MRASLSRPASVRRSRPGSSLRRARSPVAPKSTTTCGCATSSTVAHEVLPRYYGCSNSDRSEPLGLPPRLGVLLRDLGVHGDPAAGAEPVAARRRRWSATGSPRRGRPGRRRRPSRTRRRTRPAGSSSTSLDDLHGAQLRRAGHRARPGTARAARRPWSTSSRSRPRTVRDQLVHGLVGLDLHQRRHLDRARLAHHRQVVAEQVDDHQVLGAELRVGRQLSRAAPRPRPASRRAAWCP